MPRAKRSVSPPTATWQGPAQRCHHAIRLLWTIRQSDGLAASQNSAYGRCPFAPRANAAAAATTNGGCASRQRAAMSCRSKRRPIELLSLRRSRKSLFSMRPQRAVRGQCVRDHSSKSERLILWCAISVLISLIVWVFSATTSRSAAANKALAPCSNS